MWTTDTGRAWVGPPTIGRKQCALVAYRWMCFSGRKLSHTKTVVAKEESSACKRGYADSSQRTGIDI